MLNRLTSYHNSCLSGQQSLLLELVIKCVCGLKSGGIQQDMTSVGLSCTGSVRPHNVASSSAPLRSNFISGSFLLNMSTHLHSLSRTGQIRTPNPPPSPNLKLLSHIISFIHFASSLNSVIWNAPWVTSWFIYFVVHSKAAPLCLAESQKARQIWSVFSMFFHWEERRVMAWVCAHFYVCVPMNTVCWL